MSCKKTITPRGQPFPYSNPRTIQVDFQLRTSSLSRESGEVFSYKLTTLGMYNGALVQDGNAPNYQGGRITLCTCMHHHRTWPRIDVGTWIAGFSDNASGNKLFYFMCVERKLDSFDAMWRSGYIPNLAAKSASRHIFGDLYQPVSMKTSANKYDPVFYQHPIAGHKHLPGNAWQNDITFRHWQTKNRPKLLVGQPGKSFLWQRPRYRYKNPPHPRFRFHDSVADFLNELK
jgi:hypothetical protein